MKVTTSAPVHKTGTHYTLSSTSYTHKLSLSLQTPHPQALRRQHTQPQLRPHSLRYGMLGSVGKRTAAKQARKQAKGRSTTVAWLYRVRNSTEENLNTQRRAPQLTCTHTTTNIVAVHPHVSAGDTMRTDNRQLQRVKSYSTAMQPQHRPTTLRVHATAFVCWVSGAARWSNNKRAVPVVEWDSKLSTYKPTLSTNGRAGLRVCGVART